MRKAENLTVSEIQAAKGFKGLLSLTAYLKPYRWQIIAAITALIFTAGVTLSLGQGLRIIVDQGFSGSPDALDQAIVLFMVLVVLLAIGTFTRFFLVSWLGERVCADLRKAVFNHLVDLHPGFFESNGSSEIQSRITTDTTLLQSVIGSSVSIALRNLLTFIGGVILLLITNVKLTAIVLVSVPLVLIPIIFFGRRVRRLSRDSQDKVADVGSFVGESLANIKTLQAFNHQALDRERFGDYAELAFTVAVRRITQRAWLSTVAITLVLGAIGGMIWVGGNDVASGLISAGELTAFLFYAVMVAVSVGAFSEVMGEIQRAAGATERLMELLEEENQIVAPQHPRHLPEKLQGQLEIEQLVFSYPSQPLQPALNQLNLFVPAGSSMALVGASGAGKSTLFDLILRFYDPQQGVIRFDGVDISQLAPDVLRQHIGIVPQQPVLFSGTVRENIRYGRPTASDDEVAAAAKAAYAQEFIASLPEGYDSDLGDRGLRLSGGQRQRIAIARAILKDPEILLLDEATSALDADSEHMVQQALEGLMKNRTTLVIAHRLATVVNVDRIAVMEQGRVVELGTHRELLEKSPLYARWAALQFDEAALVADNYQAIQEV
jgi:ATP-binding cassette subfamily B protein